jgi:pyruvate dehydrogenase (quinone)
MLGLRYPMEVNLSGDCALTLRALLPLLKPRAPDAPWRRKIEEDVRDWWGTLEKRAMQDASPLNPQRVFWELSPRLPERVMLACDTGTTVHWYSRDLKLRNGMKAAHSGSLASMGAAMPYALAAKFAFPDRVALAMVGDGAMQMNGLNELITVARYWRTWSNPRFIVLVMNNRDLNMVSWEQRIIEGNPKFPESQDVPDISYTAFAKSLGFDTFLIDKPAAAAPAWDASFACDRPVLIEAVVDPNIPPLPPHVTSKQLLKYFKAIASGDPDASDIVRESIKQIFA